ncbi:hypothetical protein C8Q74DRAFT_290157 [Fomes fomentarius]|nr:hypothetical protein C8Q74DRAFT_290157 [Fomes fomentarius]
MSHDDRPWNPEEHYVMIEPNLKFLLTFPWTRAPLPWYARPPPTPIKPGPPPDKLRFTSTRSIHNAFQPWGCPYVQTAADDLDSFLQTFLHALLFRGGEEVKGVRHLYDKLGNLDLHGLGRTRDGVRGTFWRLDDEVKRREREERERAKKEKEKAEREKTMANDGDAGGNEVVQDASSADSKPDEDDLIGPMGIGAMAEALYKLFDISAVQMDVEDTATRGLWRYKADQQWNMAKERALEHYSKHLEGWALVKEGAEASERRKAARRAKKVAEKAEKETEVAELELTGKVADEQKMETDEDAGCVEGADGDLDHATQEPHMVQAGTHARCRSDSNTSDAPPQKRARVEGAW